MQTIYLMIAIASPFAGFLIYDWWVKGTNPIGPKLTEGEKEYYR